MIEEMDVRMIDQQAARGVAGQGRRVPVKAELRQKIQSRRRAQGQDDLCQTGLFKEPEKHELTPEEKERKERRRLQNRLAARRCREKKKKQQMYTQEQEYQQVADERDYFKRHFARALRMLDKKNIPFDMKQEADVDTSGQACAVSNFFPLLVKMEPGLEEESCLQQEAPFNSGLELSSLLSPQITTSPHPPDQIFSRDLSLPAPMPYMYGSDPLNAPGGSPDGGLWGRDLPSTSDSDYIAATPQSCVSPLEGACCPSPDLPSTQGSTGFDLHSITASSGLRSPEGQSMGASGSSDLSLYPATPDNPEICLNVDCNSSQEELAHLSLKYLKEFLNSDDEVFMDETEITGSPW